jgi:hypothetical protein
MDSIRLIQRIEGERRLATADEQRYWQIMAGGIADAFNPRQKLGKNSGTKLALDEKDYARHGTLSLTAYNTERSLFLASMGHWRIRFMTAKPPYS